MSLTQISFLPFFLSLIFLLSTITTTTSTLQNLLQSRGLPGGLFPNNVQSYNLDQNGRLEVQLAGPCMTRYETRVVFDSVVRANLSYGGLMGLEGLIQEELFLWFPVKGFEVNDPSSGLISVDIGLAHKQLSRSLFEVPPVCKPQGAADLLENFGRKMGVQNPLKRKKKSGILDLVSDRDTNVAQNHCKYGYQESTKNHISTCQTYQNDVLLSA